MKADYCRCASKVGDKSAIENGSLILGTRKRSKLTRG